MSFQVYVGPGGTDPSPPSCAPPSPWKISPCSNASPSPVPHLARRGHHPARHQQPNQARSRGLVRYPPHQNHHRLRPQRYAQRILRSRRPPGREILSQPPRDQFAPRIVYASECFGLRRTMSASDSRHQARHRRIICRLWRGILGLDMLAKCASPLAARKARVTLSLAADHPQHRLWREFAVVCPNSEPRINLLPRSPGAQPVAVAATSSRSTRTSQRTPRRAHPLQPVRSRFESATSPLGFTGRILSETGQMNMPP